MLILTESREAAVQTAELLKNGPARLLRSLIDQREAGELSPLWDPDQVLPPPLMPQRLMGADGRDWRCS